MTEEVQSATTVSLPPILDLQAADPLRAEVLALRGRPLDIDASQVVRMGGLCLQVLLSVRATWEADGLSMRVDQPSEAFIEQMAAFGNPEIQVQA